MIIIKKFLKLSFEVENNVGKEIHIIQNGVEIWGMEVENPENKKIIEYRNIAFDSTAGELEILCDFSFSSEINVEKQYTQMQITYDKKHNIINDESLIYALNGNKSNPKKILVTFPGFMLSTSDIQYPLTMFGSFLKNKYIMDNYLIIAFQDRYFASGTYMLFNDDKVEMKKKIEEKIVNLSKKYSIKENDIVFFGASKGGSIAINTIENFPLATLIISVPQMDIEYYLKNRSTLVLPSKNVYADAKIPDIMKLYQQYNSEKRKIYHLFSTNDDMSNMNFIEKTKFSKTTTLFPSTLEHGKVTSNNLVLIEKLLHDLCCPIEHVINVNRFTNYNNKVEIDFSNLEPENNNFVYYLQIVNKILPKYEYLLECHNISRKHLIKMKDNYKITYGKEFDKDSKFIVSIYENGQFIHSHNLTSELKIFLSIL